MLVMEETKQLIGHSYSCLPSQNVKEVSHLLEEVLLSCALCSMECAIGQINGRFKLWGTFCQCHMAIERHFYFSGMVNDR